MTDKLFASPKALSPRMTGILIALSGAILMSFDSVFIRFSGVSGFDTAFLFGLFTAISMSTLIQLRDKRGLVGTLKASGWPVLISGLLMLGSASSLIFSIKNTTVANVMVIMSILPAISAVWARLFLGEETRRATWVAIGFVIVGISIVVSGSIGSVHLIGDAAALFVVTCVSLNHTLLRKYKQVSRLASVGMGGFFLAIVMIFLATPSAYSLNTWLVMAMMGLFSAPFGRVLNQSANRYISVPEVGIVQMTQTVAAPLLIFFFFAEIPPLTSFIGGAIILGTIFIYILGTMRRPGY